MKPIIAIINESSLVSTAEVRERLPAFQAHVSGHVAPEWGADAELQVFDKAEKLPPLAWWIALLDWSDQQDALGYHDLTSEGLPLGKVFLASCQQDHVSWTVDLSHELAEMICDPWINRTVTIDRSQGASATFALEVSDACEDDRYGAEIQGTLLTDLVTQAWFNDFPMPAQTKYDLYGHMPKPLFLLPGGYISYLLSNRQGWQQKFGNLCPSRYNALARLGSRRERRRRDRSTWMLSTADDRRPKFPG